MSILPNTRAVLDAWSNLCGVDADPGRVEVLRRKMKSVVYRLAEFANPRPAVIVKQCAREDAHVERLVYDRVLRALPVTSPEFYGVVDHGSAMSFLFMEEVQGENYDSDNPQHRVVAAHWLAAIHVGAQAVPATSHLPDRGASHYRQHLERAQRTIWQNFENPALSTADRNLLAELLKRCEVVGVHWPEIDALCTQLPHTLVHGDFADRNVRIHWHQGVPRLFAFDWETAGRGIPATDFMRADVSTYGQLVRNHWPELDQGALEQASRIGELLRGALAPIDWQSSSLAFEWVEKPMRNLRIYNHRLVEIMHRLGWLSDS